MLFVDRTSQDVPMAHHAGEFQARLVEAARFFKRPEADRNQQRFDFSLGSLRGDVAYALWELFRAKCAYCEQPLQIERFEIDRFRPASNAISATGTVSTDHYWWLAYEWENLYPACEDCIRAKANRFPVGGSRATPQTRGDALAHERPLLLDPCKDRPEDHLAYTDQGIVVAITKRGAATIEALALNRMSLVQMRSAHARTLLAEARTSNGHGGAIDKLIAREQPFAGMQRSLLKMIDAGDIEVFLRKHLADQRARNEKRAQYTVGLDATAHDRAVERSRTRYISRVTLTNIGVHKKLTLRTSRAKTATAPWLVLLGENSVGKSTLLKAIAFALSGREQWSALGEHSLGLLPIDGTRGKIDIRFSDGEVVTMKIDAENLETSVNFVEPRFRLLALGSTRLPPTAHHQPPSQPSWSKVMNLFDPYCPLDDASLWLASTSHIQFVRAATAIRSLLDLPRTSLFSRNPRTKRVSIRRGGDRVDIRTLSDGFQTIIGVACSIMSTLVPPDLPVENAEGVVLIDEIGNHLHPAWRMRIVSGLKKAFPRVQFIATTHEPLCLRGLEDGEIAVLRRNALHRSELLDELPSVKGLLVDQILSSPYFGLGSTIDPEMSEKFQRYYDLLAKKDLSSRESLELEGLATEVDAVRLIGNTPSEQILLRTIDRRVAQADKAGKPLKPAELPSELELEFQEVLALAAGGAGTGSAQ